MLVAWIVPPLRRYFTRGDEPISLVLMPVVPNLVYAALLIGIAVGLRRRLRAAWWFFVVLLLVLPSIARVFSLLAGERAALNLIGLVVAAALLVVAVQARPQFTALTPRRRALLAALIFVAGSLVVSVVGTWLLVLFTDSSAAAAGRAIVDTLLGDLGRIADPGLEAPLWARLAVSAMGGAVILGSVAVLFRAPASTRTLGAGGEARVRTMLRDHGDLDSLGYFATRRDKAVGGTRKVPNRPGPASPTEW